MLNRFKAILFDLDGTLIDSEPYHFECWNIILADYGHTIDYEEYLRTYKGVSMDNNCARFIKEFNLKISPAELKTKKEELMLQCLKQHELAAMDHVYNIINYFAGYGLAMGLVTSASRAETDIVLAGIKLNNVFKHIITRDDVVNNKPHPEPYNSIKKLFRYASDEFLVFEDSLSGITSAKNANMTCFAINNNATEISQMSEIADKMFVDLKDATAYLYCAEEELK